MDEVAFPGIEPPMHLPVPQLTWNRESGTPEIAVRSTARNSYPALSGPSQEYVKNLQEHWRIIFRLEYNRVQRGGHTLCTLAWPEFVDSALVNNSAIARQALLQVHEFFRWWVVRTDQHRNLQRVDQ